MRKMGARSLADLIKMAEIIDVRGNSFRHRPSEFNSRSHPTPVRRTLASGKPPARHFRHILGTTPSEFRWSQR